MNTIQWGEPRPLRQSADAIPFPLGALPPVLRDMVQAVSGLEIRPLPRLPMQSFSHSKGLLLGS